MRKFTTGATRDENINKLDYSGFFSPVAMEAFAKYMHHHRLQADGTLRGSGNWKLGIPLEAYRESLVRHVIQAWGIWEGNVMKDENGNVIDEKEALCAIMFNIQGILHETNKNSR